MTERRVHALKVLPRYFRALLDHAKPFEVRRDDRAYAEGDRLVLREYDPTRCSAGCRCERNFTGRHVVADVTYVLPGGQFGIDPEYVVLGLEFVEDKITQGGAA